VKYLTLFLLLLVSTPALAHEDALPLGDGKISAAPKTGYIWSCQQHFNGNAPGAQVNGDWIVGKFWYPDRKIHVRGSVRWDSRISITIDGTDRVISANSLPQHPTGLFPVRRDDPAYKIDRNPNSIAEQDVLLRLPVDPEIVEPSCLPMGMIGFTLAGAAIFNGLDAGGRDAAAHEVQDSCDGHPERQGQYHYHSYSPCLKDDAGRRGQHSDIMGYALDGFGIYGLKGEGGRELRSSDLDTCHGHTHSVMKDGAMQDVYHYHMTADYPYTLGCFMGAAPSVYGLAGGNAVDFNGGPQAPPDRMYGGPPRDPGQVMQDAAERLHVSPEQLRRAVGPPPPDFRNASEALGIPEENIRAAFEKARGGN
jgi:hypothetical protein